MQLDQAEIQRRFGYHKPPNETVAEAHRLVRETLAEAATRVDQLVPDGREKSMALTHIEEAMFCANAGIARKGAE